MNMPQNGHFQTYIQYLTLRYKAGASRYLTGQKRVGSSGWVLPCSPGSDSTTATRPVGVECRTAVEGASDGTADIAGRWDNLSCCTTAKIQTECVYAGTILLSSSSTVIFIS